jgi:AGZA family xanthine/uracil permease-like MFS transporter
VAPAFNNDLYIYGLIALSQGFLLSAMIFAAILVFIIEREFLKAAGWTLAAAGLSAVGLIHAYDLTPTGIRNKFGLAAAPDFALMYGLGAMLLVFLHLTRRGDQSEVRSEAGS